MITLKKSSIKIINKHKTPTVLLRVKELIEDLSKKR
jgi:hypothetical protein